MNEWTHRKRIQTFSCAFTSPHICRCGKVEISGQDGHVTWKRREQGSGQIQKSTVMVVTYIVVNAIWIQVPQVPCYIYICICRSVRDTWCIYIYIHRLCSQQYVFVKAVDLSSSFIMMCINLMIVFICYSFLLTHLPNVNQEFIRGTRRTHASTTHPKECY